MASHTTNEGIYYDFKREWYADNKIVALIRDIICLANANYNEDRYLIIGCNDKGEVIGLSNSEKRLNQAKILDLLASHESKFAFNLCPKISLETIYFSAKELDIIVIPYQPEKLPFFTTQNIKKHDEYINQGVIYSRTLDKNTAKSGCANPHDIERMWLWRFISNKGLDYNKGILPVAPSE